MLPVPDIQYWVYFSVQCFILIQILLTKKSTHMHIYQKHYVTEAIRMSVMSGACVREGNNV